MRSKSMLLRISLGLVAAWVVACRADGAMPFTNDLSRAKAAELIAADIRSSKLVLMAIRRYGENGKAAGLWNGESLLTDRGRELFVEDITFGEGRMHEPPRAVVEVSGIVGPPDSKQVEFTWHYGGIPPVLENILVRGGTGNASLARYDDGWRVTDLNYESDEALLVVQSGRTTFSSRPLGDIK